MSSLIKIRLYALESSDGCYLHLLLPSPPTAPPDRSVRCEREFLRISYTFWVYISVCLNMYVDS